MTPGLRLMVVDDHVMVRRGVVMLIKGFADIELVAEAHNGGEAVRLCESAQPHVILMDIDMPIIDGIAATKEIRRLYSHIRIVALVDIKDENRVAEMLDAGADAYILKNATVDQLVTTVRDQISGSDTIDSTNLSVLSKDRDKSS